MFEGTFAYVALTKQKARVTVGLISQSRTLSFPCALDNTLTCTQRRFIAEMPLPSGRDCAVNPT